MKRRPGSPAGYDDVEASWAGPDALMRRVEAAERIAARVKETRDKTFKTTVDGRVVNRTEAIACLGGSALDNEEAYPLAKLMRALGLVYLEHQARL